MLVLGVVVEGLCVVVAAEVPGTSAGWLGEPGPGGVFSMVGVYVGEGGLLAVVSFFARWTSTGVTREVG